MRRVDGQWREHREHLVAEHLAELGSIRVLELGPVDEADAGLLELWLDVLGEDGRLALHEVVRLRADGAQLGRGVETVGRRAAHPGEELLLEPGHAHLVELVEVLAEDREELGAFEERPVLVLGQGQHPRVELEPRQLSVEESRAVGRRQRSRRGCHHHIVPGRVVSGPGSDALRPRGRVRPISAGPTASLGRRMSSDPRFLPPTPFAAARAPPGCQRDRGRRLAGSLVGSLFFQGTTSGARDKVLLALILTMAPFAVVTPVLGPALDRVQGGRRLITVLCCVGRAVLCLVMSRYITKPSPEGLLIYPLAFGALVFGKGYSISRSALVPTVVKDPTSWCGPTRASRHQRDLHAGRSVTRRSCSRRSSTPTGRCCSRRPSSRSRPAWR